MLVVAAEVVEEAAEEVAEEVVEDFLADCWQLGCLVLEGELVGYCVHSVDSEEGKPVPVDGCCCEFGYSADRCFQIDYSADY